MKFQPIDVRQVSSLRRALLPLAPLVGSLLRTAWRHSGPSRSTWFDSRRWRAVWNVNRLFACTPRAEPTPQLVRFRGGICMELDLSRLTDVLAWCYGPGEIEVGHAAARVCSPDAVIVDVGGNVGTTTLSFAKIAHRGTVHVFEPSPAMLPVLKKNLELSGATNVQVHAIGLSDQPSCGRLRVAIAGNPGSAHFQAGAEGDDGFPITVARLDDVLGELPRLDFVKIDVEGLELRVLRGAERLIRRCRPVLLFERNEAAMQRGGTSGDEVCAAVTALGYHLAWLDRGRFRDYASAKAARQHLHNVIAFPNERPLPA